MSRRFVNLVVESCSSGVYSLRRMDVSKHLFYASAAEAEAEAAANREVVYRLPSGRLQMIYPTVADAVAAEKRSVKNRKNKGGLPRMEMLRRLPATSMSFEPCTTDLGHGGKLDMFALLGPRDGRIVFANQAGHTALYDADSRSILTLPNLQDPKGCRPLALSVAHAGADQDHCLYVMTLAPSNLHVRRPNEGSCFEVLEYGSLSKESYSYARKGWHWLPLPPPPFIYDPRYRPTHLSSYTVLDGGSTICVSSAAEGIIGTYCFNTESREWSKAGGWVLPFSGRAAYVPELDNLWFGLSASKPHRLCASDLSACSPTHPPTVQHVWADLDAPEEWSPAGVDLVSLGSGRFCVAKVFEVYLDDDWDTIDQEFAVLTGVEVVRCEDEGLRMIKHRSRRYNFDGGNIRWVL